MKLRLFLLLFFISFSSASFANYLHYDGALSQYWELNTEGMKQHCASHNPYTWQAIAQKMISVKPLQNKIPDLIKTK